MLRSFGIGWSWGRAGYRRWQDILPQGPTTETLVLCRDFICRERTERTKKQSVSTRVVVPPWGGSIRLPPWSSLALKRATQVDRCGCYKVQIRIFLSPVPTRGCGWLHVASCEVWILLTERGNLVLNFKLNPDVIRSSAHLALTRGSWSPRHYPPDLRFPA